MADNTLNENLDIIAQSNLEIEYLDGDLNIIQKLDDEPNDVGGLTSQELKGKFDEGGNLIKAYINEKLIPAILEDDATEAARTAAEAAREEAEASRAAAEAARQKAEATRTDETAGIVAQAASRAKLAESWAVGGTGGREDEAVNNAKYWASMAEKAAGGDFDCGRF